MKSFKEDRDKLEESLANEEIADKTKIKQLIKKYNLPRQYLINELRKQDKWHLKS